ncbi:MAG: signal peptidase II, partial [Pseudomonadales bacterium]|nr:signal peptidase II [Pseudomonadales bacterium]
VVSIVIAVWMMRLKSNEKLLALSLSLILGGALGNLIDRAFQGYVVDFLLLHYDDWYFPAFNVADSSVSVGAALMILDVVLSSRRDSSQVAEDA